MLREDGILPCPLRVYVLGDLCLLLLLPHTHRAVNPSLHLRHPVGRVGLVLLHTLGDLLQRHVGSQSSGTLCSDKTQSEDLIDAEPMWVEAATSAFTSGLDGTLGNPAAQHSFPDADQL